MLSTTQSSEAAEPLSVTSIRDILPQSLIDGSETSAELTQKASLLADAMAAIAKVDPDSTPFFKNGLDVMIADIIVLSKRVSEDNVQFAQSYLALRKAKEDADSEIRTLQSMVHAGKHNIHSALDTVAKIETDLGNQATEVETLRRQNRVLQKERADFERRLYSERATWDRLKAEWAAEEHKLHEALKAQVIIAKAGRARSPSATAPISPTTAATFSFDPDESDQIKSLREEIKTKDEQISQLIHNAGENATSIQEITNRLTELLEEVEALRHESSDLLEQNRNLMEEAESYQILLQEKTVTGAFSTDMFLRGRAANAGGSFDMTQMPLGDELDVRSPREAEMKQQIHALTVYINKILSRIMVDERLAAVLVKSVDTDANAVPPTPTITSPTSPGPNQASSAPSGVGDGSTAPLMDEGDEAYVPPPGFGSGSSHPPATAPGGGLFLGGFIRRLSNTLTSLMPGSSGPHAHPHPPADLATVSEEGAVASPTVTSPTEEKKESEDTATEKSKDESSSAAGPDVVEVQLA